MSKLQFSLTISGEADNLADISNILDGIDPSLLSPGVSVVDDNIFFTATDAGASTPCDEKGTPLGAPSVVVPPNLYGVFPPRPVFPSGWWDLAGAHVKGADKAAQAHVEGEREWHGFREGAAVIYKGWSVANRRLAIVGGTDAPWFNEVPVIWTDNGCSGTVNAENLRLA